MLRNLRSNQIISANVKLASSFISRLLGLMGKKSLSKEECLWITHCNSIHTCFMRFNIDVVFLDKEMKIVAIKEQMSPWKFTWPVSKAKSVIEFYSQGISKHLQLGDQLHVGN